MTKKEIVEGNILIAKFMGYEYVPKSEGKISGYWKAGIQDKIKNVYAASKLTEHYFLAKHHRDIRYYNSWDWLMPVIEKVEGIKMSHHVHGPFSVKIHLKSCDIEYDIQHSVAFPEIPFRDVSYTEDTKLLSTYKALVDFINWYNKHWNGKIN